MPQNSKNAKKIKAHIHCPVPGCLYSSGSERHFTEKRFLSQHIAKVHAEKKYSCAKCQKCFGLDWWRKHHEKTCGIEWKCDCGNKYTSRESLLTHARRTQHKLPDFVISSDKMKQNKAASKVTENPVIYMIKPIIQFVINGESNQSSIVTPRPILPKTTQPLLLSLPVPMGFADSATTPSTTSPISEQSKDNSTFTAVQPFNVSDKPVLPLTQTFSNNNSISDDASTNKSEKFQTSVATQTVDENINISAKVRQSQASQCTRRKPKSLKVGIESTHTQTAESAVVKIKKRRSRRKSVAITTEPAMLTDQMPNCENSFWPGFQDFIFQQGDNLAYRLFKNSASTQTNVINSNKILCDSETLTDKDLLKFSWDDAMKDKGNENCNAEFQMLADMGTDDTLSVLPVSIDNNTLPDLNIFSDNLNNFPDMKTGAKDITSNDNISVEKNVRENNSVFSVFGSCDKSTVDNKVPHPPTLSDIHTQTMASAVLDYNLLANMETQTTDDFVFSDLEFSDTETQTPWEDFPNIDDSPLPTDQLSIEIQTDFSSFDTGLNLDPYDLINSVEVQSMIPSYSSKGSLGVNTETQTLDKFYFPQFTNTESQTLDVPDFVFDS